MRVGGDAGRKILKVDDICLSYKNFSSLFMKAAIYGAGSIGTLLGALITKSGEQIDLVDINPVQVEALRKNGARLEGSIELSTPVKAYFPDEITPGYDVIFLTVSGVSNADIIEILDGLLKDDGVIVTLQNGLPEMSLAEVLGTNRVMGATLDGNAELIAPGVCRVHSDAEHLWAHVGKMKGVTTHQAMNARNLLSKACKEHFETNFLGARWCKLLVNCSFSMAAVLYGGTFGEITKDWNCREIIARSAREVMKVGKANGVVFPVLQGVDYYKYADGDSCIKKLWFKLAMPRLVRHHENTRTTQLLNILNGRKTEIEFLCGNVKKYGAKAGVPTPVNSILYDAVKEIEAGTLKMGPDTVRMVLGKIRKA